MSINRIFILMFSFVSVLLCGAVALKPQTDGTVILQDVKLNFAPREFYIADVVDERQDRNMTASLIISNPGHQPLTKQVDLKGGAAVSVRNFLNRNLHRDTSLRPVIITLKDFKITETRLPDGRISGRLGITFSFSLQSEYGPAHLIDYTGGIRYTRTDSQPADIESILRNGITGTVSFFNDWMNINAGSTALLAKEVKVHFTDYSEQPEGDTIYYSARRPLTWGDFKDKPRDNRFEAEVFTTIGYTEQNAVLKGVIYVDIAVKVAIAKSDCWVRTGGKDAYVLNHEQRHFDIEKIVSEHFKKKILAMELPPDNFYGPINVEYLETLREATRMQKQYDAETRHGQDKVAQANWDEKIDKELGAFGVKK